MYNLLDYCLNLGGARRKGLGLTYENEGQQIFCFDV